MSAFIRRIAEGVDVAKAQNVDLLASDFTLTRGDSKVKITLALDAAVKIRLVGSSVSFYINGGNALAADAAYTEELLLDSSESWNIQTDDGSGVTFNHYAIQEESRS